MIRHSAARHTTAPSIVLRRLPEDMSQALCHISSILSVNEDAGIEPGDLQGMSRVLEHAQEALHEMEASSSSRAGAGLFSPKPIFLK